MDPLDDIHCRMRISSLEARRELREIERVALSREIDSMRTTANAREAAMKRCDVIAEECAEIAEELKILHRSRSSQI